MPESKGFDTLNLPYSLEAEQAVLGAILIDPAGINLAADHLSADHFYLPEHQAIFRVMVAKMIASQTIDFVTVLEALKAEGFFAGEEGKSAFFPGIKQAFFCEFFFQAQKGFEKVADTGMTDGFDIQLIIAPRRIKRHCCARFDFVPVFDVKADRLRASAKHDGTNLGGIIFECEIPVP